MNHVKTFAYIFYITTEYVAASQQIGKFLFILFFPRLYILLYPCTIYVVDVSRSVCAPRCVRGTQCSSMWHVLCYVFHCIDLDVCQVREWRHNRAKHKKYTGNNNVSPIHIGKISLNYFRIAVACKAEAAVRTKTKWNCEWNAGTFVRNNAKTNGIWLALIASQIIK